MSDSLLDKPKSDQVTKGIKNWLKNANDPCDLEFDLVTLRVLHVLELDYTYLQTKYEQDRIILRVSKCDFTV